MLLALQCWSRAKPDRSTYMVQHAREYDNILEGVLFSTLSTQITNSRHVSFSFLQYYDAGATRVSYLSFESPHLTLRNKPTNKQNLHAGFSFRHALWSLSKGKKWNTYSYGRRLRLFRGDLGETFYNKPRKFSKKNISTAFTIIMMSNISLIKQPSKPYSESWFVIHQKTNGNRAFCRNAPFSTPRFLLGMLLNFGGRGPRAKETWGEYRTYRKLERKHIIANSAENKW